MINTQKNLGIIYIGEIIPYVTAFDPVSNANSFFSNPKTSQHKRLQINVSVDDDIEVIVKKLNESGFFKQLFTAKDVRELLNGKHFKHDRSDISGSPDISSGHKSIELACFK